MPSGSADGDARTAPALSARSGPAAYWVEVAAVAAALTESVKVPQVHRCVRCALLRQHWWAGPQAHAVMFQRCGQLGAPGTTVGMG
jgi:hypothetical protein